MVKEGRTIAQAVQDGTYYRITGNGLWYDPPACETPAEVLACAKQLFPWITPGMVFNVCRIYRIYGGAYWVEPCDPVTA